MIGKEKIIGGIWKKVFYSKKRKWGKGMKKSKIRSLLAKLMIMFLFVSTLGVCNKVNVSAANYNLMETYGAKYGYSGNCVHTYMLRDSSIVNAIKKDSNIITLGNEFKPDYLLGSRSATLISVSEAKRLGYYIPSNYRETYVPKINFSTVDEAMKLCYQNGLKMRGHTLVWHSQTPTWLFRENFSSNGRFVSQSVMDARLEFYVKSVLEHVYSGQYGSVVVYWDVANEIMHAQNSGWEAVYGSSKTNATYVKKAFNYAYEILEKYNLTNSVKLFYNDYNTYMVVNDEIALVNYINQGKKVCAGIGMQSHLSTSYPSVDYYTNALNSFLRAGFEVQITELDIKNKGDQDLNNYCYQLFKNINTAKKNGGNISCITWWGPSDAETWLTGEKPLIWSNIGVNKSSYDQVVKAYTDVFGNPGQSQPTQPSTNPTPSVQTAHVDDGLYYIKNVLSQKYLTVDSNSASGWNNVVIKSGSGTDAQKWYLTNVSNGYVTLTNRLGNIMLDVANGESDNGSNIGTYQAYGGNAQQFVVQATGSNGVYTIGTKTTTGSKVLDVYEKKTADGTNVVQWAYNGNGNQQWQFEKVDQSSQPQPSDPEPSNPDPYDQPSEQPSGNGSTDKTATEVVSDMTVGWNIGNSLDSFGQKDSYPYTVSNETYWGNPKTTKALIDEVAKAGFNTIRIPVSWGQYTTGSNYQIPDFFMNRVKEVVDYCIANDMYVILNSHHDINDQYCFYVPNNANKSRSEAYFKSIWTQIGNEFKNYDYHLVFETMNEPRLVGHSEEWWFPRNNPSSDIQQAVACINDYNQVALNAIRATGGNNATRCVMVPGYDASIEGCMTDGFKMPSDSASNRLILSVHAYIPYYFALASDTYVTKFDQSNKSDIDTFFSDLNSKFLSRNIPVVVGETSATNRNNTAERVKWADYYWSAAAKHSNAAMVLWDNNIYDNNSAGSDGECHRYIDRNSLQWCDPEIITIIMKHVDGTPATINGKTIPSSDPQTQPDPDPIVIVDPEPEPEPEPQPEPEPEPEPIVVVSGLELEYNINSWGSGYQISYKICNNTGSAVNTWTLKVNKNQVNIDSSWNVNIKTSGNYYVITPVEWNSYIPAGGSVEFGSLGVGQIGTSFDYSVE